MGATPHEDVERRWAGWLLARNRRGTRFALWMALILYPGFGVLDYLVAPRRWLWLLYATRGAVLLATLAMFHVVRGRLFDKFPNAISAAYVTFGSFGISLMTVFMGGLASPYYAGLSLIIVTIGLLFVWPARVVFLTHATIIASFILPNLALQDRGPIAAVSNLFFLVSTAAIISTGQLYAYRTHREQQTNQLVIEWTKANLEEAHERLKQLDHFKSQFFANITHELKTPLAMLLTPLELMLDGTADVVESQRSTVEAMHRSGIKLLKLIADLLDLSKLEESRLRLRVEGCDLVAYARGLLGEVQGLAQRKGIALHFETNVESCSVWCDLERIERVLINLLSNATKFTPAGGNVWVRLEDTGDALRMAVRDDGPGFPAEMSERVFERFFQVDMAASRRYGGTGIGLALAKELVELHGGRIWARSSPGEGAVFTVELRKRREDLPAAAIDRRERSRDLPGGGQREADRGLAEWTTHLAGREEFRLLEIDEATEQRVIERDDDGRARAHTILVVEDTPDVVRVIHMALRDHFRILAASGGEKGVELATRDVPSLVITDLMMPQVDGLALTRRLRADPRTRHIPIVMLTARADLEDRVAGLETGVNAYLAKPFSARELLSTVRSLLGAQETTADILLTQRMDSLEAVAGSLAHEINNPLNYIKGSLELVGSHVEDVVALARSSTVAAVDERRLGDAVLQSRKLIEVAESGLKRIASTVALMRRYSREGYSRAPQPCDAFAAVRDVVSVVLPAMGRDVRVETDFEGAGVIECVPEEFSQAMTNIVQNAVEAAPEGHGRVWIRGRVEDEFVAIAVIDNGPGIRPEDHPKVFTPFFTTKSPGRGTGMGLTIAQRVVTSAGGAIRLKSQPGTGTEFLVRVPRARFAGVGGQRRIDAEVAAPRGRASRPSLLNPGDVV
jgi:signal transduction histidine kinase